jgi:hypothetical protein
MSIAKDVVDGDRRGITWLLIEDDDGQRWRYAKRGPAPFPDPVHIQVRNGNLDFVQAPDGKPFIRQDRPGLPAKITLSFATSSAPTLFGVVGMWTGGKGTYEYEQEPSP